MRIHWLSLSLILVLLGSSFVPMTSSALLLQDTTIDITIAYTHDLHSHLYSEWSGTECDGGMPLLSTKVKELRSIRPTLLFDCGDTVSGAPVNDFNAGIPMIEVMNEIGYDAMAIDNHEYDPGVNSLKGMIDAADFEILGANVDWSGTPKPYQYSIETIGGYDIGVIGLSPQFWYSPDDATISDQVTAANAAVVAVQDLGIEFIVLLGCLSTALASSVSGIDVLMKAGGSAQMIGNTLVVPSIGIYASQVGVLNLTIDTATGIVDSYSFAADSLDAPLIPDESIVDLIDSWNEPLAPNLDLVVGYFDSYLGSGGLGPLFAEAILQATGADVGTYNNGGIRESIDEGFVTYRDIYRTEPFFNFVSTVNIQGSDMPGILSSNYYSTSIGSFEPSTWYTVASSNFSVTYYENTYSTTSRQDYTIDVVDALAAFISSEYPVNDSDLLSVIDECSQTTENIPDSYYIGGTPSTIKSEITQDLLDASNALAADNALLAYDNLITVIDLVTTHVNVSCPRRWLTKNINSVISFLELSGSTTETSTSNTTGIDGPIPTDIGWVAPWLPVIVIAIILPVIIIGYSKLRMR